MLLHLFQWLSEYYPNFSVFNYLSLRALLAALTSMIIGFAFAPWVIRELRALKLGQEVRGYGPKSHLALFGLMFMQFFPFATVIKGDMALRYSERSFYGGGYAFLKGYSAVFSDKLVPPRTNRLCRVPERRNHSA